MKRIPFRTLHDVQMHADEIATHLRAGGLIAYPTETVYGFGGLLDSDAVAKLATLKGREETRPFLVLASDPMALSGLVWNDTARLLAQRFWPGPLTIALRADPLHYQPPVLSTHGTVAVRLTPLQTVVAFLRILDAPLTSTSANAPRQTPAMNADDVASTLRAMDHDDVWILDGGALASTPPSTVVDCSTTTPRLIREGAVSIAELHGTLVPGGISIDVR